jgi:hypothetical protein
MKHEDYTARQIIGFLDESTARLAPSITAKLAAARSKAVEVLKEQALTSAPWWRPVALVRLLSQYLQQHRTAMSAAMVCSAVFVAFIVTQQLSEQEMMGQGDAFLLASELPPEAYLDRGFDVWLERTSRQ